ncbi:MAG: TIGR01244 family phosphatase [Limimaricola sp.]|uniref:TIGR01244 family sulfur transferase n=1 Tax=Limimaricola sp. TaxID=2211665 RepID=UPI001DC95556|nr:TIGR01244 family sulfur transferase [Limimaricola sp.]MBI1416502.1 TIGR01244 family phosphatase [Limimaricola sp.]
MNINHLTPGYAVSPQIAPEDVAAIKAAGFVAIICNRPDFEVPPGLQAEAVGAAAQAAGLGFTVLPVTHPTLNMETARAQAAAVAAAGGPVLAYCASGTRSSIVWSMAQAAAGVPVDEIIAAAAQAGYDLAGQRPRFEDAASS